MRASERSVSYSVLPDKSASFKTVSLKYTNSRFDYDPNTRSIPQKLHDAIDEFQESNIWNVADPTAFGEIDGWGDFGKWTTSMLADQAPQLAMLIASGGSSMLTQSLLLVGRLELEQILLL